MSDSSTLSAAIAAPGVHRAVFSLATAMALAVPGPAKADVIAQFNAVAARTATPSLAYAAVTSQEKRTLSFVDLATVHLAMYDAVVAIDGSSKDTARTLVAEPRPWMLRTSRGCPGPAARRASFLS